MKKLDFGENPFDFMTQEELRTFAERAYSALVSAKIALDLSKMNSPEYHPFWNEGTGGCAIEKCNQTLSGLYNEYDSENMYNEYFRYANDLLFDTSKNPMIGWGWSVCPECGLMFSASVDGKSNDGLICCNLGWKNCDGVLRKLQWSDLKKK